MPIIRTKNGRTTSYKYTPGGAASENGAKVQNVTVGPTGVLVTRDVARVFTQMHEEIEQVT